HVPAALGGRGPRVAARPAARAARGAARVLLPLRGGVRPSRPRPARSAVPGPRRGPRSDGHRRRAARSALGLRPGAATAGVSPPRRGGGTCDGRTTVSSSAPDGRGGIVTAPRIARPSVLRGVPLDRHAVIEASAGTGKTFTLEHLVVELVLTADVTLDRILVATFTEKATNELRVRVRAKLEELLAGRVADADEAQVRAGDFWTLDDAARARLARALHGFDGATIATIHAFCQRVLRENAFASGRLFEEQQVDGRDTFGRALRDALRSDVARDPARAVWLEAALQAGWSIADLESLLWSCTQAKGELRPVFDPATLDAAVAAFPVDDARRMEGKEAMRSWGLPAPTMRKLRSEERRVGKECRSR